MEKIYIFLKSFSGLEAEATVVLNFGCTLESSGKLKTMLISESYPREFDLVGLGWACTLAFKKPFVCESNLNGQWVGGSELRIGR